MNFLGRIFIILIIVMSVAFMWVALMVAASHQNWKQQAEENQQIANARLEDKRAIQGEIDALEAELERERVMRQMLVSQLESQWQTANRLYESKEQELREMLADLQEKTRLLEQAEGRIQELDTDIASLDEQNRLLTENIATEHQKVIELNNKFYEQQGTLKNLRNIRASLAQSLAMAEKVLKANGLNKQSLTDDIAPPLDGLITRVGENFILVNLGTDDGLREGHTLDIHRKGDYVGQANVYRAEHNRAFARIVPEMKKKPVQLGDTVTTRWSRPIAKTETE